ncbi:MAG: DUF1700 domain-containing protein [Flexilinea sp.]
MNKNEYLKTLQKALLANNVDDIDDILLEYEQHFLIRMSDGYSEEEIAAKLGQPDQIASQFAAINESNPVKKGNKAILSIGFGFIDLFAGMFFILGFAWIFCMAVFSIAAGALGICLVGNLNIEGLIPSMPYPSALLMGVAIIALGILSAAGTIYCYLYVVQLGKVFFRWQKNTIAGTGMYPPLSKNPQLGNRFRRTLRNVSQISMLVFGLFFIAAYILSVIYSGSIGFWHVWHWFA